MNESHEAKRTVLLPKRLARRVPLIEPRESAVAVAAGEDNWGLSERIGALPGVISSFTTLDDGATTTEHYIDGAYILRSPYCGPKLLCRINTDGISLPHLDATDKAEVVGKGWALHIDDEIILFLPRDSIEMEIAWKIILRAYQYQAARPPKPRSRRSASPELPRCASTVKYWV